MARNIKDNFVDGLLQIAIFLSLIKTNLRQINTSPAISDQFDSGVSNWGQLEVSPIINTYNNDRWNPMLGVSVHPKHVENDRVEEVLRRVHSLAGYRTFERLSTRIEAFLLEEGGDASISAGRGGLRVDAVTNQASTLNIIGEEPSKDDMDLIDVLWRQDIDLGGLEDVSLMRELEKREEMRLHNKQEEETIEQLIHTFDFSQQLNYTQPESSNHILNTPEIQLNPQSPFQTFSSFLNHTDPPIQWNNTALTSPPPLLHPPPILLSNQAPLFNQTSTNHTQEPHVSITTTLNTQVDNTLMGNVSVSRDTYVLNYQLEENVNLFVDNNHSATQCSSGSGSSRNDTTITTNNYTTTDNTINDINNYNNNNSGVVASESNLDSFLNGILSDVSLSTPSEFPSQSTHTTSNNSGSPHTTTTTLNNNSNNIEYLGGFIDEFHINEQFGSLEDILGMDDFTDDLFLQQQQQYSQQQQNTQQQQLLSPSSSSTPPHFSLNNQDLLFMSGDDDNDYLNTQLSHNNKNLYNNNTHNNNKSNNTTFPDDLLLTELTDDSTFMELLNATDQFSLLADDNNEQHNSDSALSSTEREGPVDSKSLPPLTFPPHNNNYYEGLSSTTNHSSHHNTSGSISDQDFQNIHPSLNPDSFNHINTTTNISSTNHTDHIVSATTTHDHNYCLPTPVTTIKTDPDAIPSCSRFEPTNHTTNNYNSHDFEADFKPPLFPVRKSKRRSSTYKQDTDEEDEDEDYVINPDGDDDDDDDDEDYYGEDGHAFLYSSKVKNSDFDFKYPIKNKKASPSSPSAASSCRGKDDLKAVQMGIPFDVDEIIHCQAERFNEMVTHRKLTGEQVQLIKDIRKRGKNKLAAQNCRKRKLDVISALEEELDGLKEDREMEVMRRRKAMMSLQEMKQKIASMQAQILSSLSETRVVGAANGSAEFVVVDGQSNAEQTPSTAVFILPRDKCPSDTNKSRRKRK